MYNQEVQERELNLVELFTAWFKHSVFVAEVTIIFAVVALAYVFWIPPTYQAVSTMWMRQDRGLGESILESSAMYGSAMQLANTYMEIFKNQEVLAPVVAKYPSCGSVGALRGAITLRPVSGTNLFRVAVNSTDPQQAKEVNDALLESFLTYLAEINRQQYSITRHFLDLRVKDVRDNLYKAEDELQAFQKKHKIASADSAVTMVMNRLSSVDDMRVKNRINLEIANAKVSVAENQMRGKNLRVIADSPLIQSLREEIAELEKKRVHGSIRFTAKHPVIIQLNNDIRILKEKMEQEITRVANLDATPTGMYGSLFEEKLRNEAEAKVAQSNLASIDKMENDFQSDIDKLSDSNKEYVRLMRNVTVAQEIYSLLAKRLEEAKVSEVAVFQATRIASRAVAPSVPIAPMKTRTVAMAMLLGFALSSIYVVAKEMLNRTISSAEDVGNYFELPILGVIPDFDQLEKHMNEQETDDDRNLKANIFSKLKKVQKVGDSLWKKK